MPVKSASQDPEQQSIYDGVFWLCYCANTCLMMAVSLLFRYADFVTQIGGGEFELGMIVGVGMIGAIAMRIFQGIGIDRFGPRLIWLSSLALFCVSCLLHLTIDTADSWQVYAVRIFLQTNIAGAFGASITFMSLRAPTHRMAEAIGMLGSSGFLGMAIGPWIGDVIFAGATAESAAVERMFWGAAVAGLCSLVLAAISTASQIRTPSPDLTNPFAILRKFHPGWLLLVAATMGFGIGLPGTFLRAFAADRGIDQIKVFFVTYAMVAFSVRMLTRRLPDQVGNRPVILAGLLCMVLAMAAYLPVREAWMLVLPASVAGIAHAFLFPAVVAGGSQAFPSEYRGMATTLVLAMFDVGNLIGQPLIGLTLTFAERMHWPAYQTMFGLVGAIVAMVMMLYATLGSGISGGRS